LTVFIVRKKKEEEAHMKPVEYLKHVEHVKHIKQS